MTGRDRIVVLVLLGASVIAGFWFVVLKPKRAEATKLDAQVAVAQQRLQKAQAGLGQAQKAKRDYDSDYAMVARLGKAVPQDDNMPSLLYELQSAAHGARIDFRSLQLSGAAPGAAPPAPAAASSASSSAGSSSSGGSSSSSNSSSSSSSSSSSTAAPATQVAAASLPPGASVGTAGFPTMPFEFTFQGSYVDMEHLLDAVQQFVSVDGKTVQVHGRLLSVDGISLVPQTSSQVKASISATAYLLPADEGTTAGAAPTAQPSGAQPASGAAPKTPTPTATATGVAG